MYGTIWALLPPVVAIVLALITKEVYSFVTVYRHCYGSFDLYRIFSYCNAGYGDQ